MIRLIIVRRHMTTAATLTEFKTRFGTNKTRCGLLKDLEVFLQALEQNFQSFRVLAYGSFISNKPEPGDIDVMVHAFATPKDRGFNKFKKLQELASENVDVFTLNLQMSFGSPESLPDAELMVEKFNALEAHIAKGINCVDAIELVLERPNAKVVKGPSGEA